MRIKLSECELNPNKIIALENYCKKNDKLLALRDIKNRILAVGLSVNALQNSKTKEGFNHYNVIYKEIPVIKTLSENASEKEKINYENLKKNNFIELYPTYDVYITVYEGIIKNEKEDKQNYKREEYWFKCYQYYQKFRNKFSIFDLINKKSK